MVGGEELHPIHFHPLKRATVMEQTDILCEQNVLGVGEEEELAPGQGNATNGDSTELLN